MQIACERCSTSYLLDDNLIPAQGAPVQCTKCGLVFTAMRPTRDAKIDDQPVRQTGSTLMFGTAVDENGAPTTTKTFGVVDPPAPSAPKGGATRMFGAVSPAPTNPNLPKPPASTQMFGAVGARPNPAKAAKPEPAAAANPRATMMFGITNPGAAESPVAAPTPSPIAAAAPAPGLPALRCSGQSLRRRDPHPLPLQRPLLALPR